jgi:histidinol dehydrogenase
MQFDPRSLAALGPDVIALADAEGLDAHARSIAVRLNLREGL